MKRLLAVLFVPCMFTVLIAVQAVAADDKAGAKREAQEGVAATLKVPLFSTSFADFPVATVEGEKITLGQLNDALVSVHEEASKDKSAGKTDYKPVLDRLINTRLIVLEAKDMGIGDLPEVKSSIKEYEGASLRELVKDKQTSGVKPDKDEVERLYKASVKEWKLKSVIFSKEADANKMSDDVKAGKAFDDAAKESVAAGKAKGGEAGEFVRVNKLLPQIAGAVYRLDKGAVTPVIKVEDGYVVVKVEDIRYPDDPKARADAEKAALEEKQGEALKKYYSALVKKYAKIDKKLLGSFDFDADNPKVEDVLKDKRVLINIKGDKPITVGDFATAIDDKFFHGVERAAKEKKVNAEKVDMLDSLLYKRLFDKEAAKMGLEKTDDYRNLVSEYKTSVIFSMFIQKAVVPDIKVNEDETKKYYDEHIKDFTYPEMVRLYDVAFGKLKDAEDALAKLKAGTDFKWLNANAEGRLKEDTPGLLSFEGELISLKSLPDDVQDVLTGAKAGDYRLYSAPGDQYYVLYVKDESPSTEEPYKDARERIAKKLFGEKLNKSVEDWAAKLRAAHQVHVYITGIGKTSE